jgi:cold shock CspA family protein
MPRGLIARIVPEEGFGFVRAEDGEYFFHRTGLNGTEFEELAVGMPVEFWVSAHGKGDEPGEPARAVNVRIAGDVVPAGDHEPLPQQNWALAKRHN